MVSRFHCKLVRVDFGPSRWKMSTTRAPTACSSNRQRIAEHELQNGDQVNIGDFS